VANFAFRSSWANDTTSIVDSKTGRNIPGQAKNKKLSASGIFRNPDESSQQVGWAMIKM